MCIHVVGPNFQEKKSSVLIFHSIIYLYLDTYFLYYKGILAFIFEHIRVQEILRNKSLQNTGTNTWYKKLYALVTNL